MDWSTNFAVLLNVLLLNVFNLLLQNGGCKKAQCSIVLQQLVLQLPYLILEPPS